jgi:hypothetical protein
MNTLTKEGRGGTYHGIWYKKDDGGMRKSTVFSTRECDLFVALPHRRTETQHTPMEIDNGKVHSGY